jgi:hypothetical protein
MCKLKFLTYYQVKLSLCRIVFRLEQIRNIKQITLILVDKSIKLEFANKNSLLEVESQ